MKNLWICASRRINSGGSKKIFPSIGGVFGFILLALLFQGIVFPAYGGENIFPSFGSGSIRARLYSNYFCLPCRDMEPNLEPLLINLVKDGTIHLTFIDVPTSQYTTLYARYFLYALGEKRDFESAINVRRTLFEAAGKGVVEKNQLVNLLTEKGIRLKPIDLNPVFNLWNRHMQEDQIRSTPSCVIVHGDLKETHRGSLEVIKALENLKENFGKKPAGPSKEGKAEDSGMGKPSSFR